MTSRHLIFLDIDGVLAHFGSHEPLDPKCIEQLDELIDATGAEIEELEEVREEHDAESAL